MLKKSLVIATSTLLIACGSTSRTQVELTGCDHPSGWCDQIRMTAVETYLYAQMASNAYNAGFQFYIPEEFVVTHVDNDSKGFAYSIYENQKDEIVVVVFRGTEGANFKDWWYGNILGTQNDLGLALFDEIRKSREASAKFIVVGHSLGGGIALNISLRRENVDAYAFNTSPRHSSGNQHIENKRVTVVENGEVLKLLRAPSREATQKYTSIGCSTGGPISQHKQSRLAECLTQISAIEYQPARVSLEASGIELKY